MARVLPTLGPAYAYIPPPIATTNPVQPSTAVVGLDGLCDFDDLSVPQVSLLLLDMTSSNEI